MKTLSAIFLTCLEAFMCSTTGICKAPFGNPQNLPAFSVLITEILADPIPSKGLPEAEYIELYNRNEDSANLSGCLLVFGHKWKQLPAFRIGPHEYAIICDAEQEILFHAYGKVIPILQMPAVINTGSVISLLSPEGRVIHSVEYKDTWYQPAEKAAGGWSLEMIDPENPCGRADNWKASVNIHGGTPGSRNSVYALNGDIKQPNLLRVDFISDRTVSLRFSEYMDSIAMGNPHNYYAGPWLLNPATANPEEPLYSCVDLTFSSPFRPNDLYTITVLNSLRDCAGNKLNSNASADFGIPRAIDSLDVVFNEVLFDSPPGRAEFVELYNRSGKVLDLSCLSFTVVKEPGDSSGKTAKLTSFLMMPGKYAVITRQGDAVPAEPSVMLEIPAFPKLPDESNYLVLTREDMHIIDLLYYDKGMHSPFIHDEEGIALERIDPERPTNEPDNWFSASSATGYATPGRQNSQSANGNEPANPVSVVPDIFSPDGDGIDDVTYLILSTDHPGYMAKAFIYDIRGKNICTLWDAALLGSECTVPWNGIKADGTCADPGIYLIYITIYDLSGNVKKYKKVVTLARKLLTIK